MRELGSMEEFESLLRTTVTCDKILVVDFFATWCMPCTRAAPFFEKLSYQYHPTDVLFVKVNADSIPELIQREYISSLPTFKIYKNGTCLRTFLGARMDELEAAINDIYYDDSVKELLAAERSPINRKARSKLLNIASIAVTKLTNNEPFELSLSDPVFESYLLVVPGCMQFLFSMGFQEESDSLLLPTSTNRRHINKLFRQLRGSPPIKIKPASNPLLSKLESYRHQVALYANPAYQKMALKDVPLAALIQEAAKASNTSTDNVQPYSLLRALLHWFKEDFFSWFDGYVCDECGAKMISQSGTPTETEASEGMAYRVEVYSCPSSNTHPQKRFPRFNNPMKLMQTRVGRCGEWASCFCFILASLRKVADGDKLGHPWFPGVRLVHDESDHVFNEVWLTDLEALDQDKAASTSQGRWVHVDPCEELIDVPLVYEQGWHKKLSYMFAFTVPPSIDDTRLRYEAIDINDVVWKYSTDFDAVIRRRMSVSESQLARYLAQVHDESAEAIPGSLNPPFGLKTIVQELAIMLKPPQLSRESFQGRTSGEESWRRSRGEFSGLQNVWEGSNYVIKPTLNELEQECVYLRYNTALDAYARPYQNEANFAEDDASEASSKRSSPKYLSEVFSQGWQSIAMRYRNIARKVEKDWKMVYIARRQGTQSHDEGVIEWLIDLTGTEYCIKAVTLFATMAVFDENSKVTLEVKADNSKVRQLTPGSAPLSASTDFAGAKTIKLSARLYNEVESNDPVVWQKAQLFRQKSNDEDTWPLEFKVSLQREEKSEI